MPVSGDVMSREHAFDTGQRAPVQGDDGAARARDFHQMGHVATHARNA